MSSGPTSVFAAGKQTNTSSSDGSAADGKNRNTSSSDAVTTKNNIDYCGIGTSGSMESADATTSSATAMAMGTTTMSSGPTAIVDTSLVVTKNNIVNCGVCITTTETSSAILNKNNNKRRKRSVDEIVGGGMLREKRGGELDAKNNINISENRVASFTTTETSSAIFFEEWEWRQVMRNVQNKGWLGMSIKAMSRATRS
jgi:hypothetical protein